MGGVDWHRPVLEKLGPRTLGHDRWEDGFAIANVRGALTVDVLVLVLQTERDRKTYSRLPQASRGIGVCYRSRWSSLDVPGRAFPTSRYSSMPTGSQISGCLLVGSEKDDTRSLGVAFQLDGVCGHFQDVPQGPQGTTRGGALPVPPQRKHRYGEEGCRGCQRMVRGWSERPMGMTPVTRYEKHRRLAQTWLELSPRLQRLGEYCTKHLEISGGAPTTLRCTFWTEGQNVHRHPDRTR